MMPFQVSRSTLTSRVLLTIPQDMPAIRHTSRTSSRSNVNDEDAPFLQNRPSHGMAELWINKYIKDSNALRHTLPSLIEPPVTPSTISTNPSPPSYATESWEKSSSTSSPTAINFEAPRTTTPVKAYHSRGHRAAKASASPRKKKPQNAFLIFRNYLNAQGAFLATKQQNEISAKAGELWGKLSKEARKKFYELAELEKLKMQREHEALEVQGELGECSKRGGGQEEKSSVNYGLQRWAREPRVEVAVHDQSSSNSCRFEQLQDLLPQTLTKAPHIKKEVQSPTSISSFNESISSLRSRATTPSLTFSSSSSSSSSISSPAESEFSSGQIDFSFSASCSSRASETTDLPHSLLPDPSTEWWRIEDGLFDRTIDPIAEDPFFPSTHGLILPSYVAAYLGAVCRSPANSSSSINLPASVYSTGFDAMYPPLQNYINPLASDWNGGKSTCNVSGGKHSSLS